MDSMGSKCEVYGVSTKEVEGIRGVPLRPEWVYGTRICRRKWRKVPLGISIEDDKPGSKVCDGVALCSRERQVRWPVHVFSGRINMRTGLPFGPPRRPDHPEPLRRS